MIAFVLLLWNGSQNAYAGPLPCMQLPAAVTQSESYGRPRAVSSTRTMRPSADATDKVSMSANSFVILWIMPTYLVLPFIAAVSFPFNAGGFAAFATSPGGPPPLPHGSEAVSLTPYYFGSVGTFFVSFRRFSVTGMLVAVCPALLPAVPWWNAKFMQVMRQIVLGSVNAWMLSRMNLSAFGARIIPNSPHGLSLACRIESLKVLSP